MIPCKKHGGAGREMFESDSRLRKGLFVTRLEYRVKEGLSGTPSCRLFCTEYVAPWSISYEARISYPTNHMAVNMDSIPVYVKNGPGPSS